MNLGSLPIRFTPTPTRARMGANWNIGERAMDALDRADLPFPHSLPEFQRLFPDDAACAAYLEKARWGDGFACPHCGTAGRAVPL